jgi:hypothetical protein
VSNKFGFKQSTYRGETTARIRLWTLWEDEDTRSDDELVQLLGVSKATVRSYRREWLVTQGKGVKPRRQIVELTEDDIPLETIKGVVWIVPEERRLDCDTCELFEMCVDAVRLGWYLGCEKVYVEELIPGRERCAPAMLTLYEEFWGNATTNRRE